MTSEQPNQDIFLEIDLNNTFIRSIKVGVKRSNYRAALNWINYYNIKVELPISDRVSLLSSIFQHLCEADDLERVIKLFLIILDKNTNEPLYRQLYTWGEYSQLTSICNIILKTISNQVKIEDKSLIEKVNNLKIICYNSLGLVEFAIGKYQSSIFYYTEQNRISEENSNTSGKILALIGLGNNAILLADVLNASNYYFAARTLASYIKDKKLELDAISGLGKIQVEIGEHSKAINFFRLQLLIATEIGDNLRKMQSLTLLGNVYSLNGEYEVAIENHLSALKISHQTKNIEAEARILINLGLTFYRQEQHIAAITFYKQSLSVARSIKLFLEQAEALEKIAIIEYKIANTQDVKQSSLGKLGEALELFRNAGIYSGEARLLKEIILLHYTHGDIDLAHKSCEDAIILLSEIYEDINLPLNSCDDTMNISTQKSILSQTKKDFDELIVKINSEMQKSTSIKIRSFLEMRIVDLPSIKDEIDIVLITATDMELNAVRDRLEFYPNMEGIVKIFEGTETYYAGKFGVFKAIVTKCQMGSIGAGASTLATERATRLWKPRAIIMVGIAFGKDPEKQKIGDVLVASAIIPYESQRVGEKIEFRNPIPPSNPTLLNRFQNVDNWEFLGNDGFPCRLECKPILSGEKLIDDPKFKSDLFNQFKYASGGEMEGSGLCAASLGSGVPWILVKSICDWADGNKNNEYQELAANSAASLVHHVLSQPTVLDGLKKISD
jgi:nucleoside phosphorylase/tetratricopeptide (TPR) repeat protein